MYEIAFSIEFSVSEGAVSIRRYRRCQKVPSVCSVLRISIPLSSLWILGPETSLKEQGDQFRPDGFSA